MNERHDPREVVNPEKREAARAGTSRQGGTSETSTRQNRAGLTPPVDGDVEAVADSLRDWLLDAAGPAYTMDYAGNLIFSNRAFDNLQAVVRASDTRPLDETDDDVETSVITSLDAIYARVLKDREAFELDETVLGGVGAMRYRSRHMPVFNDAGQLIGICGLYANVAAIDAATAEAREQLRDQSDLVRSLADWTWETDASLTVTSISDGGQGGHRMDLAHARGRYLLEVGRFDADDTAVESTIDRIRDERPFRNAPFTVHRPGNAVQHYILSGIPRFSYETSRFLGYRGTANTLTADEHAMAGGEAARQEVEGALEELTRRIDALVDARDKAVAASDARDMFLATVSHELRTPLNAVVGFAEMCASELFGALPEPYLGYNHDILSAAHHLMRLVDDLMDLARIERAELNIESEALGAKSLIESATAIVSFEAERKNINLTVVEPKSSLVLWVDPTRARQILVNLLNNAIKFTDAEGSIMIEAHGNDEFVAISVSDTGIGISTEQQSAIFEMFNRGDDVIAASARDGLGIGLHVARRLARLMGGDIELTSTAGQGSRFTVRLPLAQSEAKRAQKPSAQN